MVSDLHGALNHPDARQEAAEILRGLIAQVAVKPESDGYSVELTGDIIKLVTLPNGDVPVSYASSVRWLRGRATILICSLGCSYPRTCKNDRP